MAKEVLPERQRDALLAILASVETEDQYIRLQHGREFKKMNLFWHGFQYLFWSDVDQDWRIPTHEQFSEISSREETKYVYDYVINIFKAHGESIIAALSADIPEVQFGPRDAGDPNDRRAIEAADNCVEIIEKWNRAKLQIITALFYLSTEGFVASYTYNKKDPTFGTVKIPQYGTELAKTSPDTYNCQNCGYSEPAPEPGEAPESPQMEMGEPQEGSPEEEQQESPQEEAQEGPEGEVGEQAVQAPQPGGMQAPPMQCPQCGAEMEMEPGQMEEVPFLSGERPVPKGREIIEIYGALNVRISSSVSKLADSGWLIHYVDADPAVFKDAFPDQADVIDHDPGQDAERLMRQSSLSMEGYQMTVKLATQKRVWFRPWMLERLNQEFDDVKKQLKKKYPTGMYFSVIDQTLLEERDESMDPHWTITKAGPSKGVHADPLLKPLVPIQELRNNLTNLFVMQVEYGVPATYADTEVFDFEGQSKQEVSPGYIYPVTPRPGQNIANAFYSEKTAVLAKESTQLLELLDQDAQFTVGDYPSIYGGPSQSGSKTLGEYDRSRSFALQRLSLVWYFLNVFWGETLHKSVLSFIEHQTQDEPFSTKTNIGWQTTWIRKADFRGSFDRLEPEVSADFPTSFSQKRQVLMALFQLNNPEINSVLFAPENAGIVQSYVGLRDFVIPIEVQRNKQVRETVDLVEGTPQEMPPDPMDPMAQPIVVSSVPIEPDIDNHSVHMDVMIDFLSSNAGQDLKKLNIKAYANCMAHLMEHKRYMTQQAMQQAQQAAAMGAGAGPPGACGPPGAGPKGPVSSGPKPINKPNGAPPPGVH